MTVIERETRNIKEFKNPVLSKCIKEIDKATLIGKRSALLIAENVVKVVNENAWKDDFKTQKDFAKFVGCSESDISTWKKAIEYNDKHSDAKALGYTIRRSYEYQKLIDENEMEKFQKWVTDNKINIGTDAALNKALKKFHGKLTDEEKAEAIEADFVEVTKAKAVDNVLEGGQKVVTISYNDIVFSIPKKEMDRLIKKYNK